MRRFMQLGVSGLAVMGLVGAGCGGGSRSSSKPVTSTTTAKAAGSITVSAAASLTEAFTTMGADFKQRGAAATATFNFGSSGTLATQIEGGAPADTFASADLENMTKLVSAGLVDGSPVVFAENKLVMVTKPGNPKNIETLADLPKAGVISLCGATVPCGRYATQILQAAGVIIPETSVTRGQDVKATVAAVTTGDADAAIVYVTDAKSAGTAVDTVTIPVAENAIARYPIATLKASGNRATSRAFVDFVLSAEGQAILRSFGFLPPS